jgi:hypothetical protein
MFSARHWLPEKQLCSHVCLNKHLHRPHAWPILLLHLKPTCASLSELDTCLCTTQHCFWPCSCGLLALIILLLLLLLQGGQLTGCSSTSYQVQALSRVRHESAALNPEKKASKLDWTM